MLRIPRPGRRLRPDRPGRGIAWAELHDPKLFEGSPKGSYSGMWLL